MKKIVIMTLIMLLILAAGCEKKENSQKDNDLLEEELIAGEQQKATETQENDMADQRIIKIEGNNYKYRIDGRENPDIKVKKGEKILIILSVSNGLHDLLIDEFRVNTGRINSAGLAEVEFIADKTGKFTYYCSVGNHRQMGMKGNFVVEEE